MEIRSIVVSRRLRARVDALYDKVAMLDHRIFRLDERLGETAATPTAPPDVQPDTPIIELQEPVPATPVSEPMVEPVAAMAAPSSPPTGAAGRRFEQILVENWLGWVGGLGLGLGGVFLVKLSIDYGLLTPPVRVVLAVLLGIGLCAASEWVTRREPADEASGARYVPQALAPRAGVGPPARPRRRGERAELRTAGACRRRRRNRVRRNLRSLSTLWAHFGAAGVHIARRDSDRDGRAVVAPGRAGRRPRPGGRLCRAGARRERCTPRAASLPLPRLCHRRDARGASPSRVVVAGLAFAGWRFLVGDGVARIAAGAPRNVGGGRLHSGPVCAVRRISPRRAPRPFSDRHRRFARGRRIDARGVRPVRHRQLRAGACRRFRHPQHRGDLRGGGYPSWLCLSRP